MLKKEDSRYFSDMEGLLKPFSYRDKVMSFS